MQKEKEEHYSMSCKQLSDYTSVLNARVNTYAKKEFKNPSIYYKECMLTSSALSCFQSFHLLHSNTHGKVPVGLSTRLPVATSL